MISRTEKFRMTLLATNGTGKALRSLRFLLNVYVEQKDFRRLSKMEWSLCLNDIAQFGAPDVVIYNRRQFYNRHHFVRVSVICSLLFSSSFHHYVRSHFVRHSFFF